MWKPRARHVVRVEHRNIHSDGTSVVIHGPLHSFDDAEPACKITTKSMCVETNFLHVCVFNTTSRSHTSTGDNRIVHCDVQVRPVWGSSTYVHYDRKPYDRAEPIRNDAFTAADNNYQLIFVLRQSRANTRTRDALLLFRRVSATGVSLVRVRFLEK